MIDFRHAYGALLYSLAGLRRAWSNEQAFRHEVLLLPVMVAILAAVRPGAGWIAGLMAAWLFVLALELLNSAIEEAFNLISPDYNAHVKFGKDMASAAIFVSLLANGVLWLGMLFSRFA